MKILNSVNPQVEFLNLVFLQISNSIPNFYCPMNKKITIKVSATQKKRKTFRKWLNSRWKLFVLKTVVVKLYHLPSQIIQFVNELLFSLVY